MNCVIIEDELAGQEIIKFKLNEFFSEISILNVIDNTSEAIRYLTENRENIDFVFLDIEIKGGSGIDVLNSLKEFSFDIIFTTAYEHYALQAFEFGATHYLLKPINDKSFKIAVNRVIEKSIKIENQHLESILITNKNENYFIKLAEIMFLKSDGAYTEFYLEDKKLVSTKNIGEFEKTLSENIFFRIHHSYIVNKSFIKSFNKGRNGKIHISEEHILPISQRKIVEFTKFLEK
jgi:two-component system LytT family response regulator